jgi:polyhydroxyalkanoate synthesis repressor PhaR
VSTRNGRVVIKKYSNRRLYDTDESRYITLDELASKIRGGRDVLVVDAKSGEDLSQVTLTQIILESRGAARLLPVELLTQLIRMGDDALAEFLGRYMSWALQTYLSLKQGAQAIAPFNPMATVPFSAINALARFFRGPAWPEAVVSSPFDYYGAPHEPAPPPPPVVPAAPPSPPADEELAALRREIEELKRTVKRPTKR